jgi:phosphinothricin acetyltransferase
MAEALTIRDALADDAKACSAIYRPHVTGSWVSFELEPPGAAEMARRCRGCCPHSGTPLASER